MKKNQKNKTAENFLNLFFIKNLNLLIAGTSKRQGDAFSTQNRTSSTSKDEIFKLFSIFHSGYGSGSITLLYSNGFVDQYSDSINTGIDPKYLKSIFLIRIGSRLFGQ
jgi:hypothetical protein